MSSLEDRTRAAMDAITGQVDGAPPLPLPPPPGAARYRWRAPYSRRRWASWLAPAAAAGAVLAIALALVAVRDAPGGRTTPAASPAAALAGVPRYYVAFNQPPGDRSIPVGLALRETLTGKTLFTLDPPRGLSFAGISAAADDRTFVADAHRDPYGHQNKNGVLDSQGRSRTWYLVRVTGTGSRVSLTMTRLPIPRTPVGTDIVAMALSPDGTKLAVGTTPYSTNPDVKQWLRVYSVATGAVLRAWSTPPGQDALWGGAGAGGDDNTSLSWIGDHALAFAGATRTAGSRVSTYRVMVLDLSRPDGDLLGNSRPTIAVPVAFSSRAPFNCGQLWRVNVLITGDGKSFVCGGTGTSDAKLPEYLCGSGTAWNTAAFAAFSFATGKLSGSLSGYRTNCTGLALVVYPVWVSATGSTVIGWMHFTNKRPGLFGVFSHGSFRPIPNPVPGSDYQTDDGSLLYQAAW
jgi:hypothetical protein